ncbi:YheT family hydrolase [Algivirga pacifica]|uniref:Alpha/beta fold hydrolase n=1 Tax=Algivirga pacifica TaxID=1162670 RepID=A0ABP9DE66_9BACT
MVSDQNYLPLYPFKQSHLSTIYPALFRRVRVDYRRERLFTPDDDFVDIDWSKVGSHRCVIVAHGLEGSSDLSYVKGVVKMANDRKWDAVALNYRGCSGEHNWKFRSYHPGATDDIKLMVEHIITTGNYKEVFLVGFSLGGNLLLKYAGEENNHISSKIGGLVAISVPCDLEATSDHMHRPAGYVYRNRFLKSRKEKVKHKATYKEASFTIADVKKVKTFEELDDMYTAPAHHYPNAREFWRATSCKHYIPDIKVPTLIINATNDPLLPEESHPILETKGHPFAKLMLTKYGGHVGFYDYGNKLYWHEQQIFKFLMKHLG